MTPLTDEQVTSQRNDLEMLKRPHLWSSSTINLKRDPEDFGICAQANDGSYRVWKYKGASFDLEDKPTMFADAEGIVDAGWKVD